ncbi:MAG: PEGA domain-containing protein, partial [Planctomycetota bacterium]
MNDEKGKDEKIKDLHERTSLRNFILHPSSFILYMLLLLAQVCGAELKSGYLQVESEPVGASIFLNGRLVGATPALFKKAPSGFYRLRLEKEGYQSVARAVELGDHGAAIKEHLVALPSGSLTVNIEPRGAEVLLNGELMGQTPLALKTVPIGSYELLIRKANFDSYSKHIRITPDEPLVFSGFTLHDKIRMMLEKKMQDEPQRISHYLDMGHYLFVNGKKDETIAIFKQARLVMQKSLNFDGLGYPGRTNMSAEERRFEQEQRQQDV